MRIYSLLSRASFCVDRGYYQNLNCDSRSLPSWQASDCCCVAWQADVPKLFAQLPYAVPLADIRLIDPAGDGQEGTEAEQLYRYMHDALEQVCAACKAPGTLNLSAPPCLQAGAPGPAAPSARSADPDMHPCMLWAGHTGQHVQASPPMLA